MFLNSALEGCKEVNFSHHKKQGSNLSVFLNVSIFWSNLVYLKLQGIQIFTDNQIQPFCSFVT